MEDDQLAGPCMVLWEELITGNRLPLKTLTTTEEESNKPVISSSHNTMLAGHPPNLDKFLVPLKNWPAKLRET